MIIIFSMVFAAVGAVLAFAGVNLNTVGFWFMAAGFFGMLGWLVFDRTPTRRASGS